MGPEHSEFAPQGKYWLPSPWEVIGCGRDSRASGNANGIVCQPLTEDPEQLDPPTLPTRQFAGSQFEGLYFLTFFAQFQVDPPQTNGHTPSPIPQQTPFRQKIPPKTHSMTRFPVLSVDSSKTGFLKIARSQEGC